jgi:glycerophosphoryl diester phosphodiesterase
MRRVGHKGADHIAPGNTLASFDAAVAHGVDMIEFDVLPADYTADRATVPLILAHDYEAAQEVVPPTFEEGLAHLASAPFATIDVVADMKLPGYEDRVVGALREFGLIDRAIVSSFYLESVRRLRELEPALKIGWSVPKVKRDWTASVVTRYPAIALALAARETLPRRAAAAVRAGRCDALMSHFLLVTPRLVRALHGVGGELYVWTVDDAAQIRRLEALGVDGIITNDPRLFGPSP